VSAQNRPEPGWQIGLSVPAGAVQIFAQALESLCYATATFVEDEAADLWRLTAYTVGPPPANELVAAIAIATLRAEIDEPSVKCLPLAESDWVAVSRSAVEPVSAGRYFIRPSHLEEPSPRGAIVLTIDAGTAFGSGDHGTTRGCLLALDHLAKERKFTHPLDLGCGSGILALAMARTWRQSVVASDIDEEAVSVTNENARINDVAALVKTHCSPGFNAAVTEAGPYDLIVANILLGPLTNMADDIARHLTTDGIAIMSGILGYQEKDLRPAYVAAGLRFISRIELDGWHTLVLSKP
jgi:ribosomal protein L11 methyltransferase